jgi:hypothetical protein
MKAVEDIAIIMVATLTTTKTLKEDTTTIAREVKDSRTHIDPSNKELDRAIMLTEPMRDQELDA